MFHKLPVTRKMVICFVITAVRQKVENSTGFPQIKEQSELSCRGSIYACGFVKLIFAFRTVVLHMNITADCNRPYACQNAGQNFLHFVLNANFHVPDG